MIVVSEYTLWGEEQWIGKVKVPDGILAWPMVRFAWSKDLESYAGGNVATGRASHSGEVEGDDPDEYG